MGFGSLGISELLVIFVIVLVFFGPKRMPEVARSLGSAMREFRVQLWVYLVNLFLLVGLSAWIIPTRGMMGAALVMVACSSWVTAAYGFLVWRGLRRMEDPEAGADRDTGGGF